MKQKLGYKSKRNIVITIMIIALLAIMGIGIYIFNNGNRNIEAISNDNVTTEQSQQEKQKEEKEKYDEIKDYAQDEQIENNSVEENNQEQKMEKSENQNNVVQQTKQKNSVNVKNNTNISDNKTDTKNKNLSDNKNETENEELPDEEYVSEKIVEKNVLVSENYVVNWKKFELNANVTTKDLSIIKPIINDAKYTVEYYYQKDGEYAEKADSSEERTGTTDTTAKVTENDKIAENDGYVFDESAENILSGKIAGDGSLVLKVYFKQVKGEPILSIKKTADETVKAGDNIEYVITVKNTGNAETTIIVTDELVGTTYVTGSAKLDGKSITPKIDKNNSNNEVLNFEIELEENSSKEITFEAKTANDSFGDKITNTAKIEGTDIEDEAKTSVDEINVKYNEFVEGQTGTDLNIIFVIDNSSSMNEPVKGKSFIKNQDDRGNECPVAPSDLSKTKLENAKKAINSFIDGQKNKKDTDMSVIVFNTKNTGTENNLKTLIKDEDVKEEKVNNKTRKYTEINGKKYYLSERNKVTATDGKQYYYVYKDIEHGARLIGDNSKSNQKLKDAVDDINISNERSGFGTNITPAYDLINNNKDSYLSDTKKNIIIVLADGAFYDSYNGNKLTVLKNNLKATKSGGEIYCIGFGNNYNKDSLKKISTNNTCLSAENSSDLLKDFNEIKESSVSKEQTGKTNDGIITFKEATLNIKVSKDCPIIASYDTGKKDSKGNPIMETLFEAKNDDDLAKYGITVKGKKLTWNVKIYAQKNLEDDENLPDTVYFKYYIPRND